MAHGLGAEVLGHFRLHMPGLEQGHGQTAKLFHIGAALNGPGLGFQFKLPGKGGFDQGVSTQVSKCYEPWSCSCGYGVDFHRSEPVGFGIPLQFGFAVLHLQSPGSSQQHLYPLIDSDLHYWQGMRQALETAGDTQSAIYKRAVSITDQHVDPLETESTSN